MEKIRNNVWKISLILIILNIVSLIVPTFNYARVINIWLWNLFYSINQGEFDSLDFQSEGGVYAPMIILGYLTAIIIIISCVLMVIPTIKDRKKELNKFYLLWIISGILVLAFNIIYFTYSSYLFSLEELSLSIPIGTLIGIISGALSLGIGLISFKYPR